VEKKTIWNFSEKNAQIALIVQKTHWDYVKKSSDDKAFSMYRTTVKRKAIQSFSGIFCYAFLHLTIKAC